MLNSEVIEINSKNIESARLLASTLSSPQSRKRGFIDILGIFLTKGYLKLKGIEADTSKSIFKIAPLFEEFKITDLYYNNYRIDVITLYKEKTVKIPKIHVDMDIVPDFYFVLQVGSRVKEAKMIGFINQRNIFSSPSDSEFYYPDAQDIFDTDRFYTLTKIMAPIRITPTKHKETMELFLKFMDNELPTVYKKQLIKHLLSCTMCRDKFLAAMEFEKLANNVSKHPSIIDKYKDETIPGSIVETNKDLAGSLEKNLNDFEIKDEVADIEQEPIRALNKKRSNVSFDRKVDEYGFDDIEYKTSSSDITSDIPVLDEDYGIIDEADTKDDKKDDFGAFESEKHPDNKLNKLPNETDNSLVKEYIKDVIQKTIKETIEENLKDAVLDETKKVMEEEKGNLEKKQEEIKKEPSILDGFKKPKPVEIIEPEPRKIEIIDYKPDEQLQKAKQETIKNREIELIEFSKEDIEQAKKETEIKSIKDEINFDNTGDKNKINKPKDNKISPRDIIFSTPAAEQLKQMVQNETIEEIFDEEKKLDITNKKRSGKRLLIVCALMFFALFLIGFIALNGSNDIKNQNNETQNINDLDAFEDDEGFDEKTIAYNEASSGQNKTRGIDDFTVKHPLPSESTVPSITKISWEAPESLVKKPEFTKFLQSIGKNIKLNLQNELLLVNDIPINKVIKADIKIAPTGDVVGIDITSSSGSTQIDDTVKKVVGDTVKYIKPPSLGLRVQNSIITLTVDLD